MRRLIYLLRHAEIDKAVPRRFLGRTDLPLNASGICQALALGEQLQTIPFTRIIVSPLKRAVQTATLISGRPVEVIEVMDALAEIDLGAWEGRTVAEIEHTFPGAYEERGQDLEHYRPLGGESFGDLADRVCPALFGLAAQNGGPLLIVAHAGVNRVLLSRLLDRPLQRLLEIPQDYGAVNILRTGAQGIEVVAINVRCRIPSPLPSSQQHKKKRMTIMATLPAQAGVPVNQAVISENRLRKSQFYFFRSTSIVTRISTSLPTTPMV